MEGGRLIPLTGGHSSSKANSMEGGGNTLMASTDVVLEVHCPSSVYQTLRVKGFDKETLSQEAREGLAMRLYGEHRLSLGKAAELAGLPIVGFMDLLGSLQIPIVEYGKEEYTQDLQTITHLTQPGQGAQ
jgi:predicted HTH domain antitoxin